MSCLSSYRQLSIWYSLTPAILFCKGTERNPGCPLTWNLPWLLLLQLCEATAWQLATIKPLSPGVSYTEHFQHMTTIQLSEAWLGSNWDKDMRSPHKLKLCRMTAATHQHLKLEVKSCLDAPGAEENTSVCKEIHCFTSCISYKELLRKLTTLVRIARGHKGIHAYFTEGKSNPLLS